MKRRLLSVLLVLMGLAIGMFLAPNVVGAESKRKVKEGSVTPVAIDQPLPVPVTGEVAVTAMPQPEPFQCAVSGEIRTSTYGRSLGPCVDLSENQRLHIVDASVFFSGANNASTAPQGAMVGATVLTSVNGEIAQHVIGRGSMHTGLDNEQFGFGRTMDVSADPGTRVSIFIKRNYGTDELSARVTVSGYIETLP